MDRKTPPRIKTVTNPDGPALCYAEGSGVGILKQDGLYFKDLAKDCQLHPYEDWRLPAAERAADLAARLSVEEIAGLMQYSMHQMVPNQGASFAYGDVHYEGKPFQESGLPPCALSDQQIQMLKDEFVRHILVAVVKNAQTSARWSNRMQAMAESLPHGIPVNISSDPRHGMDASKEFNAGAGGDISHWPEQIGLGATFDPDLVEEFGEIASKEYRALGIATALSPQVDLCTEPRWWRFDSCFSESPALAADMARAYCDGFQTSRGGREIADGWGYDSVNVMPKHWPGGGSGEGGRDSHFAMGRYNVYPGGNFELHQKPFTEGAFRLRGKTKCAAAVMPYYSVSYNIDQKYGENVGNSYSKYLITDLLRDQVGFDGVVCTDWYITKDHKLMNQIVDGKCWGVEHLSEAQRCLKIILAGVDQFGGLNEQEPVVQAYRLGAEAHGEAFMRRRFELSAKRLLTNMLRTGLFENPYLDVEESRRVVGCPDYMKKGYEAQLKSMVMLKNKDGVLPLAKKTKVYIPALYTPGHQPWIGPYAGEAWKAPIERSLVERYFTPVDTPEEADAAICVLRQPDSAVMKFSSGYSAEEREQGGQRLCPHQPAVPALYRRICPGGQHCRWRSPGGLHQPVLSGQDCKRQQRA